MTIYISLPITGRSIDDVEAQAAFAAGVIESKGHKSINPLDIGDPDESYGVIMGRDIAAIIDDADAIVLLGSWAKSRGCRAEKAVAETYGKLIFESLEEIPIEECFACGRIDCKNRSNYPNI